VLTRGTWGGALVRESAVRLTCKEGHEGGEKRGRRHWDMSSKGVADEQEEGRCDQRAEESDLGLLVTTVRRRDQSPQGRCA